MPSPLGHALAGLAVAFVSRPDSAAVRPATTGKTQFEPNRATPTRLRSVVHAVWFWCALIAALPDIDLIIPQAHRSATHSVTATVLIFIVTALVTGKVTRRPAWALASMLAAAHASHLLLDWLGTDRFPPFGLQLFWPFSDRFYISGLDVFPPVERRLLRPEAISVNARAAIAEMLIIGSITLMSWVTARMRSRRAPHPDGVHRDELLTNPAAREASRNPEALAASDRGRSPVK